MTVVLVKKISKKLDLIVSYKTIIRFLHANWYKYTKYLKLSFLSENNKKARLNWANEFPLNMSVGDVDIKK